MANINEIGGSYAGMLFGISNTIATLPGIFAPHIVGLITVNVREIIKYYLEFLRIQKIIDSDLGSKCF
jgi:ACS family sodium-dependent inorganic phosphate cotransporter-like MFS transporter 5